MTSAVAYNDVAQALASAESTVHAAEIHGCLCGALCARRDYGFREWLAEFLPDPAWADGDEPASQPFGEVFDDALSTLSGTGMEFAPLLPGDESDLPVRVEALGAWCQGFLYGLGTAGSARDMPISEQTSEILSDMSEIARVGGPGNEEPEEAEESFVNVVEFLRVAVQLIFDELEGWRRGQVVSEARH